MPFINCEVNPILTLSVNCVIVSTNVANQGATFAITETKLYVTVLTELKLSFKRTIMQNKYFSKLELLAQNPNINYLVEPSFLGINRLFVLAFENDTKRTSIKKYYLPNVEMKDYNVMIDGKIFFDKQIKNDKITYENIRKISIG